MHVEYEQCKAIGLPEFQISVFGDTCMLWVFLLDKHSTSSTCNIDGGRRGNDGQPSEGTVIFFLVALPIGYHQTPLSELTYWITSDIQCLRRREDISDVE